MNEDEFARYERGALTEEDRAAADELALAVARKFGRVTGALAGESVQASLLLVPRWRWFKRWSITRQLKRLVRAELAYRGN